MKFAKNNQFEHEHKAWQRSLEFFKQENALLKYRLSEMVDNNEEDVFLQLAEYFQNQLILKDVIPEQTHKRASPVFKRNSRNYIIMKNSRKTWLINMINSAKIFCNSKKNSWPILMTLMRECCKVSKL